MESASRILVEIVAIKSSSSGTFASIALSMPHDEKIRTASHLINSDVIPRLVAAICMILEAMSFVAAIPRFSFVPRSQIQDATRISSVALSGARSMSILEPNSFNQAKLFRATLGQEFGLVELFFALFVRDLKCSSFSFILAAERNSSEKHASAVTRVV